MDILVLLLLLLAAVLAGLRGFGVGGVRVHLGWLGFCSFVVAVLLEHVGG